MCVLINHCAQSTSWHLTVRVPYHSSCMLNCIFSCLYVHVWGKLIDPYKPHSTHTSFFPRLYWCCNMSSLCCSARCHCVLDPGCVVANFCVHAGLLSQSATMSPRHNSLEHTVTHHGTPGVSLRTVTWGFIQWYMQAQQFCISLAVMCVVPDRSPSLPPGSQHRSCFQWFGRDRH